MSGPYLSLVGTELKLQKDNFRFMPLLISGLGKINHSLRLTVVSSGHVEKNADLAYVITCTSPGLADGLLITTVVDGS